ncbi:MAG: restriction endonuclease subunit S [Clostridia bacterium]|nr:restriction endonuclease subunit S [Clostridia bacterium]
MARLGDVCKVVSGTTPKSNIEKYWDGEIDWITPSEISENTKFVKESQRKITELAVKESGLKPFPKGTVILSSRAPIGKVAIAGKTMYCNQGFKNLICSEIIYNEYLYWFLKAKNEYLNSLGRGATFKEISKEIVENIEIPLPEIDEQKEISQKFEKIDELISCRKEQLSKLDELVKARFVEMFGEPGSDIFGKGLISLGECCEINPKKGQDNRLVPDLKVSFVPMQAVSEKGEIDPSEEKIYDEVKTGFTYFAENDVLFAKITPCMENGKGAVAKRLINGVGFGSTEFHVLRPVEGISNPYWLYEITAFEEFRKNAAENMTGSAGQRRVPASFLENYKIALPPLELQNQFAAFVEQTEKTKAEVQKSLDELEILKKSLMQKYFG